MMPVVLYTERQIRMALQRELSLEPDTIDAVLRSIEPVIDSHASLPPHVRRFTESVLAQLSEADDQVDQLRGSTPSIREDQSAIGAARALYACRALEDMVGAVTALHEHLSARIAAVEQRGWTAEDLPR